jgi:glyoxylase-like metal-dependent hydrolase (beta-lactamase superfamily II)
MGKKVKVLASKPAKTMIEDPSKIGVDFGMGPIEPVKNVTSINEGDAVDLGGVELEVISIPGHTPGHIGLYDKLNRNIFVGDSIGYKIDENTFLPPIIPPWFTKEQFYASLDKLKKIKFDSICVAHYGLWDGSDAKKILDESKTVFDNFWNFFEDNRDKLDDTGYITKSLIQKYLSKSKEKDRPGKSLLMLLIGMREGFKYANKIK